MYYKYKKYNQNIQLWQEPTLQHDYASILEAFSILVHDSCRMKKGKNDCNAKNYKVQKGQINME